MVLVLTGFCDAAIPTFSGLRPTFSGRVLLFPGAIHKGEKVIHKPTGKPGYSFRHRQNDTLNYWFRMPPFHTFRYDVGKTRNL